jgi:sigma-E factor negative regulatory protein RseA
MSEKLKEAVSAAIDDEADEFELRRVLDEVHKDPALKAAWDRYHLVGAVLRKEFSITADDLREAVWSELEMVEAEDSPAPLAAVESQPAPRLVSSRLNRGTGIAVAATVALAVAIGGMNLLDDSSSVPAQPLASTPVETTLPAIASAAVGGVVSDQDQARTAGLILRHTQQRGMNQPGPGAFTKLVTYQSR